jgi:hypothetical protein
MHMITTWEVTSEPPGDLDEVFVAYARRIVLEPGRPGRWQLTIDLAEGGRLVVLFRSVHGILGTVHIDEISPRCPWLGPMKTPLMPSTTARYRVQASRGGRLTRLDAMDPNFLHLERLQDEVFWMSISMPSGELLVSRLISAAKIIGGPRREPGPSQPRSHPRARRLPRRLQARAVTVQHRGARGG